MFERENESGAHRGRGEVGGKGTRTPSSHDASTAHCRTSAYLHTSTLTTPPPASTAAPPPHPRAIAFWGACRTQCGARGANAGHMVQMRGGACAEERTSTGPRSMSPINPYFKYDIRCPPCLQLPLAMSPKCPSSSTCLWLCAATTHVCCPPYLQLPLDMSPNNPAFPAACTALGSIGFVWQVRQLGGAINMVVWCSKLTLLPSGQLR